MNTRNRNLILNVFMVVSFVCLTALLYLWFRYFTSAIVSQPYLSVKDCIIISIWLTISCLTQFFIRRFFRKVSAAELFFFSIFVFSLTLEIIPVLPLFFWNFDLIQANGLWITRLLLSARFLGDFSLFASGLFAVDLRYQKVAQILFVIILTAFGAGVAVPVIGSGQAEFLLRHNELTWPFFLGLWLLRFCSINSYLVAGYKKSDSAYPAMALALFFILVGRQIINQKVTSEYVAAGFILLVAGIFYFCYKLRQIYLRF